MTNGFQNNSKSKREIRQERQIKDFLNEIQIMIDREFLMATEQVMDGFERSEEELIMELSEIMNQIYQAYLMLMREGKVGELKWIYFSFLRSSMLEGYPACQIDYYDKNDCYSSLECYGLWGFTYIFSHFNKIKGNVMDVFNNQSKVKKYEADYLLYSLYFRFHKLALKLLPVLLKQIRIADLIWKNEKIVYIKGGELFDKTITIGQWENVM